MPRLKERVRDWVDSLGDVGRARPTPPARLHTHEAFDRYLSEAVVGTITPGLAVATFDRSGVRAARGFGVRVAGKGALVDSDTPFRWFSITKLVTAMVTLRLVEDGRLGLDDRVSDHLRWFARVDPAGRVTVEDLLRHRSGIGNPPPFGWGRPAEAPGWDVPSEVRRATLRQKPIDDSNHGTPNYSNLGYLIAGEVIRKVAGTSFATLASREILGPLRMTRTAFGPLPEAALPHELAYHPRPWVFAAFAGAPRRFIDGLSGSFVRVHPFRLMGSAFGDLSGSVLDLATFGAAHLSGGGAVLTPASTRLMRQHRSGFGLGWHVDGGVIGHTGSGIGYRSELRLLPEQGLGVAVLANVGHIDTAPLATALLSIERNAR